MRDVGSEWGERGMWDVGEGGWGEVRDLGLGGWGEGRGVGWDKGRKRVGDAGYGRKERCRVDVETEGREEY